MNYRAWIYAFINLVPAIIAKPSRWIADRIFAVLDDGIKFARWIGKGAATLATKASAFLASILSLVVEVGLTLQWIVVVEIPRRISTAITASQRLLSSAIGIVRDALKSLIDNLREWVVRRINEIINAANNLKNWALGEVNWLRDYLRNTVGKWYERLTDPVKFADWIIGAIINALFRYANQNMEKIARWFLTSSPAFAMWLARELEKLLGRMM
jgi:phage-related protein